MDVDDSSSSGEEETPTAAEHETPVPLGVPASGYCIPAPQDWLDASAERVEEALQQLMRMYCGYGHPELPFAPRFRVSERAPFLANAAGVARWALRMCGGLRGETALVYDSDEAERVCVDRNFYFWHIYRRFQELSSIDRDHDRVRDALYKFSFCHEMSERLTTVQRCIHDIYMMQLNVADHAVPNCVVRSSAYVSMMRQWGGEEGGAAKKKGPIVHLMEYVLDSALMGRYRKKGNIVYQEKTVKIGNKRYGTRAWEPVIFPTQRGEDKQSTIETFVMCLMQKETRGSLWEEFMQLGNKSAFFQMIELAEDSQFPFLKTSRNLLSFSNGIYDTEGGVGGQFYPYSIVGSHLHPDLASSKYFPVPLDTEWIRTAQNGGWWDIPTPLFQSILDYQNWGVPLRTHRAQRGADDPREVDQIAADVLRSLWTTVAEVDTIFHKIQQDSLGAAAGYADELQSAAKTGFDVIENAVRRIKGAVALTAADEQPPTKKARTTGNMFPIEVQRWVYIFLGRMLHALGTFDSWQIIPFFKGRGGSGKSTVGHVAKSFFAPSDVGILSNNSEKKFGLQSLVNKKAFVCLELKKNISLDQAEFQSMVSGEEMSVAVKNSQARDIQWRSPGLLCGNEAPGWVDAQGSIARRLAIFGFKFGINEKDSDPTLPTRIVEEEIAALIVKCNEAYRDAAERHRGEDIWKILPPYFREERLSLQRDADPLVATIWDAGSFELATRDGLPHDECYMPFGEFEDAYRLRYGQLRGTRTPPEALTHDKISQAFSDAGLDVQDCACKVYNKTERVERFIIGIRPRLNAVKPDTTSTS